MIAKFSGHCKVTGQQIIAGKTELVKVAGVWQCKSGKPLPTGTIVTFHGNQYSRQEWAEMQSERDAQAAIDDDIDSHNDDVMRIAAAALTADGVEGNTYGICYRIFQGAEVQFSTENRRNIISQMMEDLR